MLSEIDLLAVDEPDEFEDNDEGESLCSCAMPGASTFECVAEATGLTIDEAEEDDDFCPCACHG